VVSERYELRLKKQLSIEYTKQHNTTGWQREYNGYSAWDCYVAGKFYENGDNPDLKKPLH